MTSLIEEVIHLKQFVFCWLWNVFILSRFIWSGEIMKTVRLTLTLDSETNVQRKSVKKSQKIKTRSSTELTDYSIGYLWLLRFKTEFFAFMVVLELHFKLWQTLKTLRDLLKLCMRSRMKSHRWFWTFFGRIQLSLTANWESFRTIWETLLKQVTLWSSDQIEFSSFWRRTTWAWLSGRTNAWWMGLRDSLGVLW